jgi:epoxide hydrolase-like predicted phosphatase
VGEISDEEYWRCVGAALGFQSDDEIRRYAWGLFGDVEADGRMVALVQRLRGRYRTGLLSNATDILPRLLREHYHFDGMFQVEVISAMVGLAKPDPAIYELVLNRLCTAPEATIFIDDLEPNVEAAAAMGIKAIQFRGYEALVPALERFGVTVL